MKLPFHHLVRLRNFLMLSALLIVAVTALASCDWIFRPGKCDASGPVIVFKLRNDYYDRVTVQLSKDGKRITSFPGPLDALNQSPLPLEGGYYLKRMTGDAVLSMTIEEYALSSAIYTADDLYKLVIDTDPYLEKYECCECTAGDTALINILIRENRLSDCQRLE